VKQNLYFLLFLLSTSYFSNSCCHFKEDNLIIKSIEDKQKIEEVLKELGVKKEFRDIETLARYIYDVDIEQYGLFTPYSDEKDIYGRYYSKKYFGYNYLFIYFSQYDRMGRYFTINCSKFKSDELKKNKFQKCFYIGYDTPDIYYMNEDDKKNEKSIFEKKVSLRGFDLSLFPIDEKITDEKIILIRLSIGEVEIVEGKSPPSPKNMKRMLEDVLLRFQDCLE